MCSCCEGYALNIFLRLLLLLLLLLGDIVLQQLLFWALVFFLASASQLASKRLTKEVVWNWRIPGSKGPHLPAQGAERLFRRADLHWAQSRPLFPNAFVHLTHFDFPGKRRLLVKAAVQRRQWDFPPHYMDRVRAWTMPKGFSKDCFKSNTTPIFNRLLFLSSFIHGKHFTAVEKQPKGNKISSENVTRNILVMKTSLLRALATAACNFIVSVSHSLSSALEGAYYSGCCCCCWEKDGWLVVKHETRTKECVASI